MQKHAPRKACAAVFFRTACFCWEAKILSPNDTVKDLPAALVEAGENGLRNTVSISPERERSCLAAWSQSQVQYEPLPASWRASLRTAWCSCQWLMLASLLSYCQCHRNSIIRANSSDGSSFLQAKDRDRGDESTLALLLLSLCF